MTGRFDIGTLSLDHSEGGEGERRGEGRAWAHGALFGPTSCRSDSGNLWEFGVQFGQADS